MSAIRTLIAVSSLVIAVPVLAADAGTPASTAAAVTSAAPVATPAVTVTSIGDVRRGSMVTVEGTVERILDTDEFRLADA
nr:hypothetical protein [Ideonella sp.]